MFYENRLWVATSKEKRLEILPQMANRHGLIAGATGTGKTVTLKVLAESFSDAGVPVFLADVKGDLAGMCQPGVATEGVKKRLAETKVPTEDFIYQKYPVCFWDIFAKKGLPLRTTISEMGPTLLARLLDLTATQEDILTIVFRIADDEDLLLLDTKDLCAMLNHVGENNKEYGIRYGNLPRQSINSILRGLLALEEQGADQFFGEPALDIHDWFHNNSQNRGMIHILHSESLIHNPMMYSTFMLWMLSELFEVLPEVGDCEKPKMIFFFDEAHLLFKGTPKALLQKIEQVVKLIRSKGVGIYFITQSPGDIPDGVLGQLGNKIQHALHAYTPAEQKAIRAAANSFRVNPKFDTKEVLEQLGIGEALVSFLQEDGIPAMVERGKILPPQSQMSSIDEEERKVEIRNHHLYAKYETMIDRDSAYEFFQRKGKEEEALRQRQQEELQAKKTQEKREREEEKEKQRQEKAAKKEQEAAERARKRVITGAAKSAAGTIGREIGNEIGKSVGGSFGKKLGGNLGASIGRGILGTLFGR